MIWRVRREYFIFQPSKLILGYGFSLNISKEEAHICRPPCSINLWAFPLLGFQICGVKNCWSTAPKVSVCIMTCDTHVECEGSTLRQSGTQGAEREVAFRQPSWQHQWANREREPTGLLTKWCLCLVSFIWKQLYFKCLKDFDKHLLQIRSHLCALPGTSMAKKVLYYFFFRLNVITCGTLIHEKITEVVTL